MMEEAITSETSVSFYQTTLRNYPEDSQLNTRLRENLKSHFSPEDGGNMFIRNFGVQP
jgi:hypothetical protein